MYVYAAVLSDFFSPPSSSLACTIWNCSFQSRLLKYQNWHKSVRILWFGVRLLGRPPLRGGCPSQLIDNSGTLGPNLPPALTPHAKFPQFVYLLFSNSLVVFNQCLSNMIHHYAKEGPPKSHTQPTTTKIWSGGSKVPKQKQNNAHRLRYQETIANTVIGFIKSPWYWTLILRFEDQDEMFWRRRWFL